MVELVDFKRVEDQIDKLLVNVVHLDDEVGLVNRVVGRVFRYFVQDTLLLELVKLRTHVFRPEAQVVNDLLSDYVFHVYVLIRLDETDLRHFIPTSVLDRANQTLDRASL